MWITKVGAEGRPLLLGLSVNGALVSFAALTTPLFRLRRKTLAPSTAVQFTVISYVDPNVPAVYNAQVIIDDWTDITEGEYIGEVVATYAGAQTFWPDDSYIRIRVLRGV